jgi:hypothetical protein
MFGKNDSLWAEKWEKARKGGRIRFAILKGFYVAGLITIIAYAFVYFTDYQLKVSREEFVIVLFFIMFIYKSLKNYFFDWPKNEKRYLSGEG